MSVLSKLIGIFKNDSAIDVELAQRGYTSEQIRIEKELRVLNARIEKMQSNLNARIESENNCKHSSTVFIGHDSMVINPATGLPMLFGDSIGVDVSGKAFGTD